MVRRGVGDSRTRVLGWCFRQGRIPEAVLMMADANDGHVFRLLVGFRLRRKSQKSYQTTLLPAISTRHRVMTDYSGFTRIQLKETTPETGSGNTALARSNYKTFHW